MLSKTLILALAVSSAAAAVSPAGSATDLALVKERALDNPVLATDLEVRSTNHHLMKRIPINPFQTFQSPAQAGVKVGLIVGGVTTFNTGVSNCDMGNIGSCVSGIISGLLLVAAGLWAPFPAAAVQRLPLGGQRHENLLVSADSFDANSSHPAHRFFSHYNNLIAARPELGDGSFVGFANYTFNDESKWHRLAISPRSSKLFFRKRQVEDGEQDDGSTVSYEWTDEGTDSDTGADNRDTSQDDYNVLADDISGYIVDNEATSICVSQCVNGFSDPYEVGVLRTQDGTNPSFDPECAQSPDTTNCD